MVERSIGSGQNFLVEYSDTVTANSYLDTNLVQMKDYYYRVYAYNAEGNSLRSNEVHFRVDPSAVVEAETEVISLEVAPNPNDGNFAVMINCAKEGNISLQIFSVTGQVLYEKLFSNNNLQIAETIDLSNVPKGMYIVQVIADKRKVSKRFVIN